MKVIKLENLSEVVDGIFISQEELDIPFSLLAKKVYSIVEMAKDENGRTNPILFDYGFVTESVEMILEAAGFKIEDEEKTTDDFYREMSKLLYICEKNPKVKKLYSMSKDMCEKDDSEYFAKNSIESKMVEVANNINNSIGKITEMLDDPKKMKMFWRNLNKQVPQLKEFLGDFKKPDSTKS